MQFSAPGPEIEGATMAISQNRFAFPTAVPGNAAASSGDGASVESAFDPNTGQRIPGGGTTPADPGRMDTSGGLDSHLSRSRGSERDYRETYAASSGVHGGGATGLALPSDVEKFSTTGPIPADSARTIGPADRLVVNDVLPKDSNLTAGDLQIG